MEADPSETKNIAADHPDIVQATQRPIRRVVRRHLARWLAAFPVARRPCRTQPCRTPRTAGLPRQAAEVCQGPGFANDWLTGWTDAKAKVWFDIDVVTAGDYEIEIAFACPPADAGSRLRISVGSESFETVVPAAPAPEIPLPHRDEDGKARYRNREWTTSESRHAQAPERPGQTHARTAHHARHAGDGFETRETQPAIREMKLNFTTMKRTLTVACTSSEIGLAGCLPVFL